MTGRCFDQHAHLSRDVGSVMSPAVADPAFAKGGGTTAVLRMSL